MIHKLLAVYVAKDTYPGLFRGDLLCEIPDEIETGQFGRIVDDANVIGICKIAYPGYPF